MLKTVYSAIGIIGIVIGAFVFLFSTPAQPEKSSEPHYTQTTSEVSTTTLLDIPTETLPSAEQQVVIKETFQKQQITSQDISDNTQTQVITDTPLAIQPPPTSTSSTNTPNPVPPKVSNGAPCVYNHAYQENYQNDSISNILKEAENCYVLIDPYEDSAYKKISTLHSAGNIVGCYISIGTGEDWRDDFTALKQYLAKKAWGQWTGEYFVSETTTGIISLMKNRINALAQWGCDYVEFDNMDWAFDEDNIDTYNLHVSEEQAVTYNQTLCSYVHTKGMKCMAKNTRQGATMFDGGTYESYPDEKNWWDTTGLKTFLNEGKIGIIVHYNESNCDKVYAEYKEQYGNNLSFICEDKTKKKYVHY